MYTYIAAGPTYRYTAAGPTAYDYFRNGRYVPIVVVLFGVRVFFVTSRRSRCSWRRSRLRTQ